MSSRLGIARRACQYAEVTSATPEAPSSSAEAIIEDWLQKAVVGLNLCPFARGPVKAGRVRIEALDARDLHGAVSRFAVLIHELLGDDTVDTILGTFPQALDDFDDFLDAWELAHAYLEDRQLESEVQLASFHPEYRFEGVEVDAPSNYTNRSPLPVLQVLRVPHVAQAIDAFGDTSAIPDDNIATVEGLSADEREGLRVLPGVLVRTGLPWEEAEHLGTAWQGTADEPKRWLWCEGPCRVSFAARGFFTSRTFPAETYVQSESYVLRVQAGRAR